MYALMIHGIWFDSGASSRPIAARATLTTAPPIKIRLQPPHEAASTAPLRLPPPDDDADRASSKSQQTWVMLVIAAARIGRVKPAAAFLTRGTRVQSAARQVLGSRVTHAAARKPRGR